MRRRRTVRPASRQLLVLVALAISTVIWLCWEVGRAVARVGWWRVVVAITSGLTFVMFAVGDYLQ